MKSYKEYEKKYIGSSDIASLTIRSTIKADVLNFGEDGNYYAYIVDEDASINDAYKLVFEGNTWLAIFDDVKLVLQISADIIKIYRAGDFGCIIQTLSKNT